MKKSLIALAALGAFAGAASAQSSVTLFGVVDLSLNHSTAAAGTLKRMNSNSYNSNRLGFRGVEDLGGGLKGAFWLEAGMANDTGDVGGGGTQFFNRRSTLALQGGFGEVRMGRDYTPQFWNTTVFDAFGTNGPGNSLNISTAGAAGALGSGATTFVRANNSVGYFLPGNLGGLYGQVQVSAGEAAVGNKHTSFRLGYAAGPLDIAVASGKTETGVNDFKMTNIGASYNFGMAKVMGYINTSKFGAVKERLTHLGGAVPFGATTLRLGYTQNNTSGGGFDARDAKQLAVGLVYDLSKRTALYTDFSRISNSSGAAYTLGPANSAGHSSRAFDVGVRHSF